LGTTVFFFVALAAGRLAAGFALFGAGRFACGFDCALMLAFATVLPPV